MLAASLPVSFGGWGLRELSAVVALQAIGLSSASALLVALLIGFLSLVADRCDRDRHHDRLGSRRRRCRCLPPAQDSRDYAAALDWLLPLAAATAVFFQIYIPTG